MLDGLGIDTCFITCYIVVLTTVVEVVEEADTADDRLSVGAAAGIAAIVFVTASLVSIGS